MPTVDEDDWFCAEPSPSHFKPVFNRTCRKVAEGDTASSSENKEEEVVETSLRDSEGNEAPKLFNCPEEGCVKLFQRYSSLERHLLYGKCFFKLEKENLMDKAMVRYTSRVHQGTSDIPTLAGHETTVSAKQSAPCCLKRGWALKVVKKATRFTERQKTYLLSKFQIGQTTGHKLDPEIVQKTCDTQATIKATVCLLSLTF